MSDNDQPKLIDLPLAWEDKWKGMPEFNQEDKMPWRSVKVHFKSQEDRQEFARLVGQKLTNLTPSIWFPKAEAGTTAPTDTEQQIITPKYPVYVISKGRWDSRLTSKALEKINVLNAIGFLTTISGALCGFTITRRRKSRTEALLFTAKSSLIVMKILPYQE